MDYLQMAFGAPMLKLATLLRLASTLATRKTLWFSHPNNTSTILSGSQIAHSSASSRKGSVCVRTIAWASVVYFNPTYSISPQV